MYLSISGHVSQHRKNLTQSWLFREQMCTLYSEHCTGVRWSTTFILSCLNFCLENFFAVFRLWSNVPFQPWKRGECVRMWLMNAGATFCCILLRILLQIPRGRKSVLMKFHSSLQCSAFDVCESQSQIHL